MASAVACTTGGFESTRSSPSRWIPQTTGGDGGYGRWMLRSLNASVTDAVERELVLLLCSSAARRAAQGAVIDRLLATCDEGRLLALLDRLRLTALVSRRIQALGGDAVFSRLARAADTAVRAAWLHGEVQAGVQRRVLERLTQAGISAASLKGPDLAQRIYGDLALRPSSDVDVLVDPDRLHEAVAVVQALGYGPRPSFDAPWLAELHHQLVHPTEAMPVVEVHWRAEWYSSFAGVGGFARSALERSRPDAVGVGRRIEPADELALLLLIYARDCLVGLRLPADIAAWWDIYGPDVAGGALQALVEADPPLAVPLAAAALTCERLVGLPAGQILDTAPARVARGRLAMRLADPFLDEPAARSTSSLVDGLLSSRRTLLPFIRRRVLPPIGHVELLYGGNGWSLGSLGLRILQAQHPIRQLAYYAWFVGSPPPRTATGGRSGEPA